LAWNKVDLEGVRAEPPPGLPPGTAWVATSAVTGAGIEDLRAAISDALLGRAAHESSGHSREIAQRHRRALSDAGQALDLARAARRALEPLEIQAEHLRAACEALDAITGATTPEDVLDLIFARFCLGK
ncbi:MAG TPA: tRNA uridine-5-carboxymethylaminomethyl(34) synthesis GTPase MnmE, partial [Myxococcota bacterium]|nr:tRNA uridine-5-carboxymethylaminomethyl(34) synthesis GTPase MnmE [Myxococcota bacterium]